MSVANAACRRRRPRVCSLADACAAHLQPQAVLYRGVVLLCDCVESSKIHRCASWRKHMDANPTTGAATCRAAPAACRAQQDANARPQRDAHARPQPTHARNRRGEARRGEARRGEARRGEARRGEARHCRRRLGVVRGSVSSPACGARWRSGSAANACCATSRAGSPSHRACCWQPLASRLPREKYCYG